MKAIGLAIEIAFAVFLLWLGANISIWWIVGLIAWFAIFMLFGGPAIFGDRVVWNWISTIVLLLVGQLAGYLVGVSLPEIDPTPIRGSIDFLEVFSYFTGGVK